MKQQIQTRAADYASLVYTDGQIANAKKDRADLNRLKKALNDERIRQEKEFLQPFNEFKAQVKELCGIIDKATASVDKQIKDFEEQQKQDKLLKIKEYFDGAFIYGEAVNKNTFNKILDPKWLNASVSMKSIQEAIDAKMEQIAKDLAVIGSLPSYAFEARECYLDTLDLAKAVSEARRLQEQAEKRAAWEAEQQKRKEEAAAAQIKPTQVMTNINGPHDIENIPARQWVSFQALLSADEAKALGAWFRTNGIKYKDI